MATELRAPTVEEVKANSMMAHSALVLYKGKQGTKDAALMELYQIDKNTGLLHSPRRINEDDLAELGQIAGKRSIVSLGGMIPSNVFYVNKSSMGIYLPAGVHRIFLNQGDTVKAKEELVWLPAMVFFYSGPRHYVKAYWCKGTIEEVREDRAVLTGAPMPNVSGGTVCLGTSMSNVTYTNDIESMADVVIERFFGSAFNEWRTKDMREIMNRCKDIAADPDVRTIDIQKLFWHHVSPEMHEHLKSNPWRRFSQSLSR